MTQQKNLRTCPNIVGLTLDKDSLEAIEFINGVKTSLEIGWVAITLGQLSTLFAGLTLSPARAISKEAVETASEAAGPILGTILKTGVNTVEAAGSAAGSVSYSIFSSNWEAFFFSYGGLQAHAQNQIEKVILKQALRSDSTPKERLFWGTLAHGCKAASKGKQ